MRDASQPPQYEALVYLGYDEGSQVLFAHWMDTFGGAYSVPHGTGTIKENSIEFIIPYEDTPFKDTFIFDAGSGEWELFKNAQDKTSNTWVLFAS